MRTLASLVTFFAVTATLHAQQQSLVQAQRETMAAERTIATAWEGFAVDNNTYTPGDPNSGITSTGRGPDNELHWARYVQLSFDYVRTLLEPKYVQSLPRTDGWGNPFQFAVHFSKGASDEYVIRSLGADGTADDDGSYVPGATTSAKADIVYSNGMFITYPAGVNIAPMAQTLTYGDWKVTLSDDKKDLIAMTMQDSDKLLAYRCFTESSKCVHVLIAATECVNGGQYSVLVNSNTSALAVNCYCSKNGEVYELAPLDFANFNSILRNSTGYIGFAIPLASGVFKVVRFSLNGASKAMAAAETAVRKKDSAEYH